MTVATLPLTESAREIAPWIIERRRHLHRHPELSFHEEQTAAFVEAELRALGFEAIRTRLGGNYSLIADLPGADPGRIVALRADMDALPIQEATEWEFQSQNPGVSHMCGHDSHTAMLLGAARLLMERRAELPQTVRFIFQGAEEKFPGGARDVIADGGLDGVERVFGLHIDPRHDVGTIRFTDGPQMAGVDEFSITVRGVGGHAAFPHVTRDPILAASHIVVALQQIVSRRTDPLEAAVVSVTQFHGGSAFNVIPGEVTLNGTIRSFRDAMHPHFRAMMAEVAENTARAFGCEADLHQDEGYPPLVNDPEANAAYRAAAREVFGEENVLVMEPVMGAEDFALYTRERPCAFAFLGCSAPHDRDRFMVHHPRFYLDEDCLWRGAAVLAGVASGA
ncbi:MAG: M20 family metallopeptidase [Sumerlaeia bacterium]